MAISRKRKAIWLALGLLLLASVGLRRQLAPSDGPDPIAWLDDHRWSGFLGTLQTRLTAPARAFPAGTPIHMMLVVRNVGPDPVVVDEAFAFSAGAVAVRNPDGRVLPVLRGPVHFRRPTRLILPREQIVIDEYDIASLYYLRRPGRYAVRYRGREAEGDCAALPPSLPFEIEVVADPAASADGDPVGKILAALPEGWAYWGESSLGSRPYRPGEGLGLVPGSVALLVHKSLWGRGASQRGVEPIHLWLTRAAAPHEPAPPRRKPITLKPSLYLGGNSLYHGYIRVPESAAAAWPTAARDLQAALGLARADEGAGRPGDD